jgi:hypothetical protein
LLRNLLNHRPRSVVAEGAVSACLETTNEAAIMLSRQANRSPRD